MSSIVLKTRINGGIVNTKLDLNVKGCFKKPKKKQQQQTNKQTNKKLQNIKFREEKKNKREKLSMEKGKKFGKQSIRENLVRTAFPGRGK